MDTTSRLLGNDRLVVNFSIDKAFAARIDAAARASYSTRAAFARRVLDAAVREFELQKKENETDETH